MMLDLGLFIVIRGHSSCIS